MSTFYIGIVAPHMKDGSETRDGSACAVRINDDRSSSQVVGIQEERLSGIRYDNNIIRSIRYCLNALDYSKGDKLIFGFSNCMEEPWTTEEVEKLMHEYGFFPDEIIVIDHHVSHAFEAFVSSGFSRSLVLVIDGCGNAFIRNGKKCFESQSYYLFQKHLDGSVSYSLVGEECFEEPGYGELFRSGTRSIGFPGYHHASKLMAIAGIAKAKGMTLADLNEYAGDQFKLKIPVRREDVYTPIVTWFSQQGIRYVPRDEQWYTMADYERNGSDSVRELDYYLAGSIQKSYETFLIHRVETLCREHAVRHICVGGGNALNCVANGKLFDSCQYTIHAGFAPSDAGQSLGNLLFLVNRYVPGLFVDPIPFQTPYIGISYSKTQIIKTLERYKGLKTVILSKEDLAKKVADRILSGQIIGLFEKGSEMGPRALGHRSILGDPSSSRVIQRLRTLKHREDYQPFALSTLENCFEHLRSPYMSIAPNIDANEHSSVEKIIHCDGTCRIQTVAPESGLLLFDILTELKNHHREGVINTSFNGRSKPIVESPSDALCFFVEHQEMDVLVIDSFFITRENE